jgi:hypothetical protein
MSCQFMVHTVVHIVVRTAGLIQGRILDLIPGPIAAMSIPFRKSRARMQAALLRH